MPSTHQYAQAPPSSSPYTQFSMAEHVLAPVYSTGPYYADYQNDPYQLGNMTSYYQQNTYERAAYGAGHGMVATYTTHAAGSSAPEARSADYAYAAPATSYTDAALATSHVISPVIALPPQPIYAAAAAPAYQ